MKYIPYVNIKAGTRSCMRYSNGNTLPLVQRPFGMLSLCPQTNGETRWLYSPDIPCLEGVRLTHQPSPWIGDYATMLFMPQRGVISDIPAGAWSSYREDKSVFRPDYMKISFNRSGCDMELCPTERGAIIRVTASDNGAYLSFLPTQGNYHYRFRDDEGILYVVGDAHSQDDAKAFRMYVVIKFDKNEIDIDASTVKSSCAHIAMKGCALEARFAISYVDFEQAVRNLDTEIGEKTFEELRTEAENAWESYLGRIEIEANSEEQMRTFYSCMYRAFLFPHKAYELDENGIPVHYAPRDGTTRRGVRYTDNGFWDTFRTVFPLYTLICRDEYREMIEGFVCDFEEGGYLPRWTSIGEVGCMPSTLIDAVICEAVTQKIIDAPLAKRALDGMLHHANTPSPERRYGREGIAEYLKYGYVPCDLYKESVNLTVDFSYGDWCIATVAKSLGYTDIYEEYMSRSKNYKSLFDKKTGFLRGIRANGTRYDSFVPTAWGGDYTEACAWQCTLSPQHDLDGLAELFGGTDKMIEYLDALFATPPTFEVQGYGGEIHEMSEMACVDFGQCAISNQPSFHIPYIYAYFGKTEKSEHWVRRICTELFRAEPDGYPGDEDNGSMSAWYILSCLGIYRMCPGKDEWVKIKPLVKGAKILGKQIF